MLATGAVIDKRRRNQERLVTDADACIEALFEAADQLGESPTKAQYEALGLTPSASTILRVMGGWNRAKRAAELETNHSRGPRVASKPESIELPDGLVWEELSQDQRWHYRNQDWNVRRTLDRRERHRAWIYEYKRQSDGCVRCGEADPACLDFHHVDEDEKDMAVGKMVTYGYAKSKLLDEIAKCEILCANCHRKEHYEVPSGADRHDSPDCEG